MKILKMLAKAVGLAVLVALVMVVAAPIFAVAMAVVAALEEIVECWVWAIRAAQGKELQLTRPMRVPESSFDEVLWFLRNRDDIMRAVDETRRARELVGLPSPYLVPPQENQR